MSICNQAFTVSTRQWVLDNNSPYCAQSVCDTYFQQNSFTLSFKFPTLIPSFAYFSIDLYSCRGYRFLFEFSEFCAVEFAPSSTLDPSNNKDNILQLRISRLATSLHVIKPVIIFLFTLDISKCLVNPLNELGHIA